MIEWYEAQYEKYGPRQQGVGWKRAADWRGPYLHAQKAFGKHGKVWDLGCGIGLGRKILKDCEYYGCDVVKSYVAHVKHPQRYVWVGDHTTATGKVFDYVVMGGIFNVAYAWSGVCEVTTYAADTAKKGFSISFTPTVAKPPFTTFPLNKWARLLTSFGKTKVFGPYGCSYVAVVQW